MRNDRYVHSVRVSHACLPLLQTLLFAIAFTLTQDVAKSEQPTVAAEATIRSRAGTSEIVIQTSSRLAGAIHSLTWNGKEFIDSADHGRQLQSASNFDAGSLLTNETFNPTEAGSRHDGAGPTSSSRLLHLIAKDRQLQSTNQMAFWLKPGETSDGNSAKNPTDLSNHLLTKRVGIGYRNLAHVIQYDVTFSLPVGEIHRHAVFEAVTGYMPFEFSVFKKFNLVTGDLEALDDGPGEQAQPVVLTTAEGSHAMGIFSPDQPSRGYEAAGYGRFRFSNERVVKWNCVFRRDDPNGLPAGEYCFRNFVIVGDLAIVQKSLRELQKEFAN